MYNVALNKEQLQSGRNFVRSFILEQRKVDWFPDGSPEALLAFMARSHGNWQKYENYLEQSFSDDNIFSLAWNAITQATVAAELVAEMHWVLRMEYKPLEGEHMTGEQRQFSNAGNTLLRRMMDMVNVLSVKPKEKGELYNEAKLLKFRIRRLNYAQHVTELGVAICQPPNYAYEHPDTSKWLEARARTQRNLAAALIESARLDEGAAKK